MKLILIIFTIFFVLSFTSSVLIIDSSSIINNFSQLLYTYLNPIFQNTFQQLIELIHEFNDKYSQIIDKNKSLRSNPVKPAEWVSQLFNGSNSIQTQWNSHIVDFFSNIQTIYENDDRSSFDFSIIKIKLHLSIENLIKRLKELLEKNINQVIVHQHYNNDLDRLRKNFQQQISHVFDNTKKELNQIIDDLIESIFNYWNSLKDRVFG